MTYPEDKGRQTTLPRLLLVVAACVAALVLPFLLVSRLASSPSSESPPPQAQQAPVGSSTTTTTRPSAPRTTARSAPPPAADSGSVDLTAATESCRLANLRLTAALSAADVSLAQFDKHIEAMNLLVAGKISYAVATQFWDETRVGATQNAAAFRAADTTLRASKAQCPRLDPVVANTLPYGPVVAVTSCASYMSSGNAAMAKARVAVKTWEHHIEDMEMLRMGHITPAQATAMWTKNWHTGDRQLSSYESTEQKAKKIRCTLS
jgi:hypothetical protein